MADENFFQSVDELGPDELENMMWVDCPLCGRTGDLSRLAECPGCHRMVCPQCQRGELCEDCVLDRL